MIETKMGEITLKGSKAELIADLAVIVRGIKETIMENGKETEESVKQEINEAVKIGLMNEEEFKTIQKEKMKEIVKALFDGLADKFVEHGYKMPRLVFWNVNSRSGIIPMQENEAGVILVSGFNQNAIRMVITGELDPFLAIKAVLDSERYKAVELALQ